MCLADPDWFFCARVMFSQHSNIEAALNGVQCGRPPPSQTRAMWSPWMYRHVITVTLTSLLSALCVLMGKRGRVRRWGKRGEYQWQFALAKSLRWSRCTAVGCPPSGSSARPRKQRHSMTPGERQHRGIVGTTGGKSLVTSPQQTRSSSLTMMMFTPRCARFAAFLVQETCWDNCSLLFLFFHNSTALLLSLCLPPCTPLLWTVKELHAFFRLTQQAKTLSIVLVFIYFMQTSKFAYSKYAFFFQVLAQVTLELHNFYSSFPKHPGTLFVYLIVIQYKKRAKWF